VRGGSPSKVTSQIWEVNALHHTWCDTCYSSLTSLLALPVALSGSARHLFQTPQQLGGNVSLALLLTVVSNVLGSFTMPFIVPHVVAATAPGLQAAAAAQKA
jgi:hypothetical protein